MWKITILLSLKEQQNFLNEEKDYHKKEKKKKQIMQNLILKKDIKVKCTNRFQNYNDLKKMFKNQ